MGNHGYGRFLVLAAMMAAGGLLVGSRLSRGEPAGLQTAEPRQEMTVPRYNEAGELLRPEGYETWVLVGASIGLGYSGRPRTDGSPGMFHNVYIQPEAYLHYVEHGEFPEKTMLAMSMYSAGEKVAPSLSGYFEGEFVGFEVAVKDHERLEEGWGYYNFGRGMGQLADAAQPFPKEACYSCHSQNARDDNVFVQFYPILRRVKEATQ